jgi:hypothetical protein
MLVYIGFVLVICLAVLFTLDTTEVVEGIFGILLYGYSFIVFYSLRDKFREEIYKSVNLQIEQTIPPPQYGELLAGEQELEQSQWLQQQVSPP